MNTHTTPAQPMTLAEASELVAMWDEHVSITQAECGSYDAMAQLVFTPDAEIRQARTMLADYALVRVIQWAPHNTDDIPF